MAMSEKRRYLLSIILCFLLVNTSLLYAQTLQGLSFTISNDWHTPNAGYNLDDGMTYGAHITFDFDIGLELKLDGVSFTDKVTTQTRYDIIAVGAFYPFTFDFDHLELTLEPYLSLLLGGNFGFSVLQNSWHLLRRIPILRIDYITNTPVLTLQGGDEVTVFWPLGSGDFETQAGFTIAPAWVNRVEGTIAYYPDHATRIGLSYRYLDIRDLYPTQRDHLERYQGFEISLTHQSGPLSEYILIYPEARIAYGSYIVNVFGFHEPKTFSQTDWTYSFGFALDNRPGLFQLFEISYKHIGIEIQNTNGSIKNNSGYEIARHQGGLYALNYRFDLLDHPFLRPYVKPFVGAQRFAYLANLTPVFERYLPAAGVEVGVRFGSESSIVFGATAWHPRLAFSGHYLFGYKKIKDSIPNLYSYAQHKFQLGILLALDIDHDVKALRGESRRPKRALAPYLP